MAEQLTLNFTAKARRTDPAQSCIAAGRKNRSGTLSKDCRKLLKAIKARPGMTAKYYDLALNGKAHRRSKDLVREGLIWRDETKKEMTLNLTAEGEEFVRRIENANN